MRMRNTIFINNSAQFTTQMFRLLLLTTLTNCLRVNSLSTSTIVAMSIKSVDFEVFGRVQGVFFRKFTKSEADKLGLRGWCRNTSDGTVQGQMEGPNDKVESMKKWLQTTGSPSSKIDKAVFKNDKEISDYSFNNFEIRRDG